MKTRERAALRSIAAVVWDCRTDEIYADQLAAVRQALIDKSAKEWQTQRVDVPDATSISVEFVRTALKWTKVDDGRLTASTTSESDLDATFLITSGYDSSDLNYIYFADNDEELADVFREIDKSNVRWVNVNDLRYDVTRHARIGWHLS